MRRLIGIFGAAGFGREVLPLLRGRCGADELVFVEPSGGPACNGIPVMAEADFLGASRDRAFVIAIADGTLRRKLHGLALSSGAIPLDVCSQSAELLDAVQIGQGHILCGHSTISSNTRIGIGFHLNVSSYLAHDCVVGDFVTFGPNVVCAGNVHIEDLAYLGAGALIRQGTPDNPVIIGAGAIVGMGAVVTRSVPRGTTVVGAPARPLEERLS